jgi:hypothetical protein
MFGNLSHLEIKIIFMIDLLFNRLFFTFRIFLSSLILLLGRDKMTVISEVLMHIGENVGESHFHIFPKR